MNRRAILLILLVSTICMYPVAEYAKDSQSEDPEITTNTKLVMAENSVDDTVSHDSLTDVEQELVYRALKNTDGFAETGSATKSVYSDVKPLEGVEAVTYANHTFVVMSEYEVVHPNDPWVTFYGVWILGTMLLSVLLFMARDVYLTEW